MKSVFKKTGTIISLLKQKQFQELKSRFLKQIYRNFPSFGLRRDTSSEFLNPNAKIEIKVRELSENDIPGLFDLNQSDLSASDLYELTVRKKFLEEKLGKCFVAVTAEGVPCYFQWLIFPQDNERIQVSFKRRFPWLKADEALLENAYTPPRFRGLGIMPAAMSKICEKAAESGARWVLTFVAQDNIPSLKGCHKAGFKEYLVRSDKWYLHPFFRSLKFTPIEKNATPSLTSGVAIAAQLSR